MSILKTLELYSRLCCTGHRIVRRMLVRGPASLYHLVFHVWVSPSHFPSSFNILVLGVWKCWNGDVLYYGWTLEIGSSITSFLKNIYFYFVPVCHFSFFSPMSGTWSQCYQFVFCVFSLFNFKKEIFLFFGYCCSKTASKKFNSSFIDKIDLFVF